jgi:hypothetical protein
MSVCPSSEPETTYFSVTLADIVSNHKALLGQFVGFLRLVLGEFATLRKATVKLRMSLLSVRPCSWNNPPHTGQIFVQFGI